MGRSLNGRRHLRARRFRNTPCFFGKRRGLIGKKEPPLGNEGSQARAGGQNCACSSSVAPKCEVFTALWRRDVVGRPASKG